MVDLVEELTKLLHNETSMVKRARLSFMIEEAKAGEYHDYKNQKYDCGKFESAQRLDRLGFHELSSRIKNGEFDEEPDEDDKKMLAGLVGDLVRDAERAKPKL